MKERHDGLGVVANIAVLERELGKLEYQRFKVEAHLASDKLTPDQTGRLQMDSNLLQQRRTQLLKLLDDENARLANIRDQPP